MGHILLDIWQYAKDLEKQKWEKIGEISRCKDKEQKIKLEEELSEIEERIKWNNSRWKGQK